MSTETPLLSYLPPPRPRTRPEEGTFYPSHAAEAPGSDADSRNQQLSLLVEINSTLAGALDVDAVLEKILSRLADRERLSYGRIYRLNEVAGELECIACGGRNQRARRGVPLEGPHLVSWSFRQKEAVYVPWIDKDPRCVESGGDAPCVYVVPLQTHTRLLGVLEVAAAQPDGIRAVTRKLIEQFATQVALALERSDLGKQLRVSEERVRSIFEQVHVGLALASLDGRLETVNRAFARLLEYEREELRGQPLQSITHPGDFAAEEEQLRALRSAGTGPARLELRYVRKSAQLVWCDTSMSLLHDAFGRPVNFLLIVRAMDEQKKAEEERRRLQQQLYQAQKMEALGTLAGGIAHDLNNLLSVMLGFASLAHQRLQADDPLQDSMGMIEQSAQKAAELTRQLLGLARPGPGQIRPVCVDEVLDRVTSMVKRTFDRRISIALHKAAAPLWVKAEPTYLEQALLNLCINARDAMPNGGTLSLEAHPLDAHELSADCAPGAYVGISVRDTGEGITPEILPRVFEPFFTTKDPGRGTGLGLAMVYSFVKNHEGFVKVESEPAKGAHFTLALPLIPPPPPPPARGILAQVHAGRGTILVVDDEKLVRAFAEQGLKGLGYQVLIAENGREALAVYRQRGGEIDCVLLDLIMPEVSGLDAFRQMRAIDPEVRVVLVSGYSTGEILRDAPEARSAVFLGKPYTLAGLSTALRKAGVGEPRA